MHASTCDLCGSLLCEATIVSREGRTEKEEAFLASVRPPTAPPACKGKVVLIGGSQRVQVAGGVAGPGLKFWLSVAAMVLLFLVGAAWTMYQKANLPHHLLAKAYTARRTMEVRLADAAYAPMRTERGAAVSSMDRPDSLMEAEPKIKRALAAAPYDPKLLQARAQAELLEWQFNPAIANLNRALQPDPKDVSILIDLASANFQKAEAENAPQYYGTALEVISKVTRLEPQNGTAWFNRAMIQERLKLFREAEKSFEQFLILEKSGGWATEAQQHLIDLKKK